MTTIKTTEQYRNAVRYALAGSDPALIQDALYDVDEFLRSERSEFVTAEGELSEEELVERALENFGSPAEVAASYRETEQTVAKALAPPVLTATEGSGLPGSSFFGVLVDPYAYGALFTTLLGLFTGIFYFTWALTGVSLSLGLILLIIGIPFLIGFAASLRILGLMEGRMLEGLTGVRMPRKPAMVPATEGWLPKVRYWLTDRRTWTTLLYMILSLPLGIIGFVVAIILLSFALAFIATPFAQLFFDQPVMTIGSYKWHAPWWSFPFFWLLSVVFYLLLLHSSRLFVKVRVSLAKALLVE